MAEKRNSALKVLLGSADGDSGMWVDLPVEAERLQQVFRALEIKEKGSVHVKEVAGPNNDVAKLLSGTDNLDALNTIAVFLSDMPDHEWVLACAIAQMDLTQFGDNALEVYLNVLGDEDNLTGFEVIDAFNETELGRYWAAEENLDMNSEAELAAYGRENMADGGTFTEWGYVRCQFKPRLLYDIDRPPEGLSLIHI